MSIQKLIEKAKIISLTLRVSILTIFITLFSISMLSLTAITYFRFSEIMAYTSNKLLKEVSSSVFQNIQHEFQRVSTETQLVADLIARDIVDTRDSEISAFLFSIMQTEVKTQSSVQAVFWSSEKGNFAISATNGNNIVVDMIIKTHTPPLHTALLLDLEGNVLSKSRLEMKNYDPRTRPWYIDIKNARKTIITDIYKYSYFGNPHWGITISTPIIKNTIFTGAFSAYIRLDFLRHLIESITISKNGMIFIVSDKGKLVAYPKLNQYLNTELTDIHTLSQPGPSKSFDTYLKNKKDEFEFQLNHKNYFATYKVIPGPESDVWLLGIVAPEDDFVGDLKKANLITVAISFLLLILGIFIMSKLVSLVVNPLKNLIRETEKIKRFDLKEDVQVKSHIKEISDLSAAIDSMKKGLRSFQKYVPANLVRQLIETGQDARIGGTKKQVAVFFSDIKNFTTISEHQDANQLMTQMCDYFNELSHIITELNGTIDKYIGDSIMAFWGAPLPEKNPCYLAAKAALNCQKRLNDLNTHWKIFARPILITRIGIHFGEAIIGNLGSTERLNYTAIGDTINIASRLENSNKIYATQIIVSEPVYNVIKDYFILRMLDRITLKGKTESVTIYELIAEKNEPLAFDINQYTQSFSAGFSSYQQQKWDSAIDYFMECITLYPTDTVAPIFIQRCKQFKINPPHPSWHGTWQVQ